MRKMLGFLVFAGLIALSSVGQAAIVVQWDFNAANDTASTGTGTLDVIGGATHPSFNSGNGSSDPTQPGSAYQTTTYPGQGTASGTAGIRIDLSTVGFESANFTSIEFGFDLRTSNTSSRWFRADYSVDGGANWIEGVATRLGTAANAGDTFHNGNLISITDAAIFNNPNTAFRVVSVFSPNAFTEANSGTNFDANVAYEVARNVNSNYGGGTWRFDMVTVSATAVPEPTAFALLAMLGFPIALSYRRRAH